MAVPAIDRNVLHMQVKACFKLPVIVCNYQRDCMTSEKSARESRFKFRQFIFVAGGGGGTGQRSGADDG